MRAWLHADACVGSTSGIEKRLGADRGDMAYLTPAPAPRRSCRSTTQQVKNLMTKTEHKIIAKAGLATR